MIFPILSLGLLVVYELTGISALVFIGFGCAVLGVIEGIRNL